MPPSKPTISIVRLAQEKLARKPNDPLLLYLQADILTQKGGDSATPEFRLAMRSAKQAVALQPSLAPAHTVLAKLYMQTGHYQEAIEQCGEALAIDLKDRAAVYRLIQALRRTGQEQEIPELLSRLHNSANTPPATSENNIVTN
jgi:tetratricopeptide (TPR) repeat protein